MWFVRSAEQSSIFSPNHFILRNFEVCGEYLDAIPFALGPSVQNQAMSWLAFLAKGEFLPRKFTLPVSHFQRRSRFLHYLLVLHQKIVRVQYRHWISVPSWPRSLPIIECRSRQSREILDQASSICVCWVNIILHLPKMQGCSPRLLRSAIDIILDNRIQSVQDIFQIDENKGRW